MVLTINIAAPSKSPFIFGSEAAGGKVTTIL